MTANKFALVLLLMVCSFFVRAQPKNFSIVSKNSCATIVYSALGPKLDSILAHTLANDIKLVTGVEPLVMTDIKRAKGNVIIIGNIESAFIQTFIPKKSAFAKNLFGKWERYATTILHKPTANIKKAMLISGSDARGTAYGVFALSEKIGVSPWYWWADVPVKRKQELVFEQADFTSPVPAVKYRGIFINDEDWGLQPWAAKTLEPETGDIGPKTYAKVFELLLRLKANLLWPAMHPSTKAFFHYPGNVTAAKNYEIVVGSSHAEPMLRNNVGEWDAKTMGAFNYFTNKEKILNYWEDRVKESKDLNAIYSLGMRGVHDGQMEGIKDLKQAVPVLEKIISEERELLSKQINKDVTAIPQVLTPYKEVLDIYDNGLNVPDDVTLVWPDDNYGYIHRLNNEKERERKGGAGVYYHASYWGRPHDYLWLPSTHPSLVREEMLKAYETGADRLWVLNVGDIKPQEYNIQQFLDMAYNPSPFTDSKHSKQHLLHWATGIFGKEKALKIQSVLWDYYNLAFERRPEFMGWSQTEPTTTTNYTDFNHFYFGDEAQNRIDKYHALEHEVKKLRSQMNAKSADAFYQLVYYPVVCASFMNKKFLYRDKAHLYAKQNRLSAAEFAELSKAAYDSIVAETKFYNTQLAGGKWKNMMSMSPRDLPVYKEPVLPAINIAGNDDWNIAPEGFVSADSSLLEQAESLHLPAFDDLNRQKYFIDIFLSKEMPIDWKAAVSHNWIRVSKNAGQLRTRTGEKQVRIWIDIDWSKLAETGGKGIITFAAKGGQKVVQVNAKKLAEKELSGYNGFVANNGYVAIHASNFTRQNAKASLHWKAVANFGYTGKVLQALPLSVEPFTVHTDSIQHKASFVEYHFYSFAPANPAVIVYALPTHPINNNMGVRYAVSIDNGPVTLVDIKTVGRSPEWKQNVLRNRSERKLDFPHLEAGKHFVRIYCIDPGVIIDELRIDLGGLKKAYSSIAETRIHTGR